MVISQTIYKTRDIIGTEFDMIKAEATVYVPKIKRGHETVWRSHYLNATPSYALFDYNGDPANLSNSIIRETCFGNLSLGMSDGGADRTKLEKFINGDWVEI